MPYLNFTDALMEAKRRAQLSGRPVSQQEVEGIAKGFASSAAEKNIQEETLTAQKSQFAESLAQRKYETEKQIDVASHAAAEEKRKTMGTAIGGGVGAVAGGVLGTVFGAGFGGVPGWAVGGGIGAAAGGTIGGVFGCIIISVCTDPNSYEVQIARGYRDKFMDEITLTGYYALCLVLVPLIQKHPRFKKVVKNILVNRLVAYGEGVLGVQPTRHYRTSRLVSKAFLGLCGVLGSFTNAYLEARNA